MLTINRISGSFIVEIGGIDLSKGLNAETLRELADALYSSGCIVIRRQRLSKSEFLSFGRLWGQPQPHVLESLRMPGYPELMTVGNTGGANRTARHRNGAVYWHTDKAYEQEPSSATMLYSVRAPRQGGETLFADMHAAYEALDEKMKARLAGLRAAHLYGAPDGSIGGHLPPPTLAEALAGETPPAFHPLVLEHPVTGRKALYAVAGTAFAVEGLTHGESRRLLAELRGHALQERFVTRHRYAVGDVIVWDTLSTLHSATAIGPATNGADSRLLYRLTVKGLPAVKY